MRRIVMLAIISLSIPCAATNYYVSSSGGNDSNNGTSSVTPWKTLAVHINGGAFVPGDAVYLKRGDTWNEQLIPPSSGTSGSPIRFDAYGVGEAPILTAAAPVAFVSGSWSLVSGSTWKATIPSTIASATANLVQFGTLYGRKQPYGSGCASSIVSKYDWCLSWPYVYVYSPPGTNPVVTYAPEGSIVPIVSQAAGLQMISVNGRNWLTFQHIKVQTFDYAGVGVAGASDNLVFANMESDGMVPYGTTPLGFYVNAVNPASIQFLNDDAHLNYDGFRFDGTATAITVTNCRAYANRDAGLKDNTGNKATYSYSHFYGNNIAQLTTADVVGGTAGVGNVSSSVAPVAANFNTYPARFSFTVDDVGSSDGTEDYVNSFLTTFSSRGLHFNVAVVPSYPVDWASVNSWYAAGNEIDSHSWSHQYYTTNTNPQNAPPYPNAPALDIRYTGSGSSATLTISGNVLSTSVVGASGDNLSINLASASYDTMSELKNALSATAHYTVSYDTSGPLVRPNTHSVDLKNVSSQDIKTATYVLLYDQTKLVPDEMSASKNAIQSNVAGLSESFYVYPDGIEDPSIEADAIAAGYAAARGSLAMKGQDNATVSANSVYSNGVNVQNITSLSAMQISGMTQGQISQLGASLVFRAAAWGAPYGFFTHYNTRGDLSPDISNTELAYLLDAITANGGVWLTNMAMAGVITSGPGFSGTTRYVQNPTGGAVDLTIDAANSPTVGRGVATAYPVDLEGVDRSTLGAWDIGARAYLAQRCGMGGAGKTYIGGWPDDDEAALPQKWVDSNEWVGTTTNTIALPASGTGGAWTCGGTNYGPYTAGSQTNLQQAINDAEACRAANSSGTTISIPGGALFTGGAGLTLPQTAGDTSSNFIVLTSTTPLPFGQTVCSHGIQDNVPGSTQPGIRNLGCDGAALSYQVGTTVSSVSGAFTLANGTTTSSSAYDDVASMYTIEYSATNGNGIETAGADANGVGPHHFAILNAEIRPQAGLAAVSAPVAIGQGSETTLGEVPSHIHLAYDYLHGDWTDAPVTGGVATGAPTGANSLPNVIAFSGCIYCSVSYSYADRAVRPGAEGHAISNKLSQQTKIVHNWFEGQSSGMFCGGWSTAIPINGFITCQDVEDRGNRYTYPYSWILAYQAGLCPNGLACGANGYVRKNAHESKFSQRYLFDGNILENVDNSGGQNGTTMSWKTSNTSGGASGDNYWTVLADTTITNNIQRLSCNGPNWGFRSQDAGNGGGVAQAPERALFANNLLYGANTNNPGCALTGNTSTPQYGFRFNTGANGNSWTGSALRDAAGVTATLTLTSQAGGLQSAMSVGDPVQVSNCSDASFNTAPTAMGPPALGGTEPSGLTVTYASPGTPNATATGCTFNNVQGYPRYLTHTHNSDFLTNSSYAPDPQNSANGGSVPYALARDANFTNDIFVGGGLNSTFQEGTRTSTKGFDPETFVFNHNLLPGRDAAVSCPGHNAGAGGMAACYTEYDATSTAISPPVTLYGTPASYCTGNDPTLENCVGVVGAMSQGSFPAILNDWHDYRLCHAGDAACNGKASPFAGGGAFDSADGTDLGTDTAAIDTAETSTWYCANCGIGSSSDVPGTRVSTELFGVHYNQKATPYPATNFSTFPIIRLWDTKTGWADMLTSRGLQGLDPCTDAVTTGCDFSDLDAWLDKFGTNAKLILTMAKTPNFIASNPADANCGYTSTLGSPNGSCTPPTDVNCDGTGTDATYIQFLTAMWDHLISTGRTGRIAYLEGWNEFNVPTFWDNSYINATRCAGVTHPVQKILIRLTQDMQCVLQGKNCNALSTYPHTAMDPAVKIMSPTVAGPGPNNQAYVSGGTMYNLLQEGVGNYVDAMSTHGYLVNTTCTPPTNSGCSVPETIDAGLNVLKADMSAFGVNKPIMISEFSWGSQSETSDPQYEQAFVSRYYPLIAQQGIQTAAWYYLATSNGSSDWSASTGYSVNAKITPVSNTNSWHYSYQATVAGTTGASQPDWSACQTLNALCAEGTGKPTWKNVGLEDGNKCITGTDPLGDWGTLGPILQRNDGTMCPTGSAVNVMQGWLNGAILLQPTYIKTARNDCAAGSNVYEFPLMLANGKLGRIVYYEGIANTASCPYLVPSLGFGHYTDMGGTVHSLIGGSPIVLDNRAVLLTVD